MKSCANSVQLDQSKGGGGGAYLPGRRKATDKGGNLILPIAA